MIEGLLHDARRDLGPHAQGERSLVDHHGPTGPASRVPDGLDVERNERAQVHHLDLDALLGQPGGRLQRPDHHGPVGNHGAVGSLAHDPRFPEREPVFRK